MRRYFIVSTISTGEEGGTTADCPTGFRVSNEITLDAADITLEAISNGRQAAIESQAGSVEEDSTEAPQSVGCNPRRGPPPRRYGRNQRPAPNRR